MTPAGPPAAGRHLRGDVVLCAAPGDFGKPRPAVVVQSDAVNATHPSTTLCPLTSAWVDAPLFRPVVEPTRDNGLRERSQVMVDKVTSLANHRITDNIGRLDATGLHAVDAALAFWLGLR